MYLQTLHPLLEDGCQGKEEPKPFKKVAFIGISNWALDPAKMNRGIFVQREVPEIDELTNSALLVKMGNTTFVNDDDDDDDDADAAAAADAADDDDDNLWSAEKDRMTKYYYERQAHDSFIHYLKHVIEKVKCKELFAQYSSTSLAGADELKELLVKGTGFEGHGFKLRFPFSWVVIDVVDELLKDRYCLNLAAAHSRIRVKFCKTIFTTLCKPFTTLALIQS
ncbi:hypothetical protein DPMN_054300 [Dreissena polymorpha]|uniref:Uncharacterized protein n=1 Tax=Dreissena polymorpha TaxID=45954 RepID=A0A9D4CQF3_DREPO|nr:hypothetical protein DPMN_054300 [Dreissena polymorpha]